MKKGQETTDGMLESFVSMLTGLRALAGDDDASRWAEVTLTMAQLKVLVCLVSTEGCTARSLADKLGVSPSAITPIVDQLVAAELARREPDENDRRIIWIHPTPQGTSLHDRLMGGRRAAIRAVVLAVPASERAAVAHALEVLEATVGDRLAARTLREKGK